jgi:hypothetical protein
MPVHVSSTQISIRKGVSGEMQTWHSSEKATVSSIPAQNEYESVMQNI